MKDSHSHIPKAQALLDSARTNQFNTEEKLQSALSLAALMMEEANRIQTTAERHQQAEIARMMQDPIGKAFTLQVTDQCFRSRRPSRIANQLRYITHHLGMPSFLSVGKKWGLRLLSELGGWIAPLSIPIFKQMIRKETERVILPGENSKMFKHLENRQREGVRMNLNHLGEAILGEEEAERRLHLYLKDLENPQISCISVKISTLYSQNNLLSWDHTLETLAKRLRLLYRAAIEHPTINSKGQQEAKFVNLDMEEYRDLHLTVALFQKVLDEPAFHQLTAGIALQSYLPDSFLLQQKLTEWAIQRAALGRAPIKIRIVKGANLAMEKLEASLKGWPQAPYPHKSETDANFKRMLAYGCLPANAKAVRIGVGSHNLFDIAYALILRSENHVEAFIDFEMLEGMAGSISRVVHQLSGSMLLYCPVATTEEFQNAIAYLVRRLDENTAPENFLRHSFDLHPASAEWKQQAEAFSQSYRDVHSVKSTSNRTQNRRSIPPQPSIEAPFENESDTDWSILENQQWATQIITQGLDKSYNQIPLVIDGKTIHTSEKMGKCLDPSVPNQVLCGYLLATDTHISQALDAAKKAEQKWTLTPIHERAKILANAAQQFRLHRGTLIQSMIANTGKTIPEADAEISEAIDFAEYYRHNLLDLFSFEDISWKPKGTVLIAPPWNFPCSIPAGGIAAALAAGNCVLFKPAPEAFLVGWEVAKRFWDAGISQDVLQFIPCEDDPIGTQLVQDPRLNTIVLTGGTDTAKRMLKMRPGLDLMAETGGKNSLIITALSDRDLAIKDLVQSAFGHSGQKCSACSLAILEAEVYDDAHFLKQLKDAVESLPVGSAWNPATKVNPLIHAPNPTLLRGLTQLESGESWLLKPKQDPNNPNLWSPGIKLGVKKGSFTHQTELFGPILAVMRADDLMHAIELANDTPYGLTAGIHSLDLREQMLWINTIEAGNLYLNRTITGAIVRRQPFGGCKESSFGRGAKAGGPNYLTQLMHATQISMPQLMDPLQDSLQDDELQWIHQAETKLKPHDLNQWHASLGSYTYYRNHYFCFDQDPSQIPGQENRFRYVPTTALTLRVQSTDTDIDVWRFIAAAVICHIPLNISCDPQFYPIFSSIDHGKKIHLAEETEATFIETLSHHQRIRLLSTTSPQLQLALAQTGCSVLPEPVLANGRFELLNLVREESISMDIHRYGNLDYYPR